MKKVLDSEYVSIHRSLGSLIDIFEDKINDYSMGRSILIINNSIDEINNLIRDKHYFHKNKGVMRRFIRHWMEADGYQAIKHLMTVLKIIGKINNTNSHNNKGLQTIVISEIRLVKICIDQMSHKEYVDLVFHNISSNIRASIIKPQDLRRGDLIHSYKTKSYLRRYPLSFLVSIASDLNVTHTSICAGGNPPMILTSSADTKGLGLIRCKPDRGEVYIVARPKIDADKIDLLNKQIELWLENYNSGKRFCFGEAKCWGACGVGFILTKIIYLTKRYLIFSNPVNIGKGYFCSEFIDEIFKKINIQLSYRSKKDRLLGPIELLHSPIYDLLGIICNEDDIQEIERDGLKH